LTQRGARAALFCGCDQYVPELATDRPRDPVAPTTLTHVQAALRAARTPWRLPRRLAVPSATNDTGTVSRGAYRVGHRLASRWFQGGGNACNFDVPRAAHRPLLRLDDGRACRAQSLDLGFPIVRPEVEMDRIRLGPGLLATVEVEARQGAARRPRQVEAA
jgi:hypothetical protein